MNRIHETLKHEFLLLPQSQNAGANTTGSYKSIVNAIHDALLVVQAGALAEGKKLTVEVFQADDAAGTNAAEIADCETVFTAPAGGATSVKVLISLDTNLVTKPYITVKVTNDAAVAVLISAFVLFEPTYRTTATNSYSALKVV